jgi:hypothetical protein
MGSGDAADTEAARHRRKGLQQLWTGGRESVEKENNYSSEFFFFFLDTCHITVRVRVFVY